MKPFRFTLETVLESRRSQETQARQVLAIALEKQREATARSAEALHALNLLLQTMEAASAGRFSVADRERFSAMRRVQEKVCAELRVAAQECTRLCNEKRAAVVLARRNCELLERLKTSRLEAWQKDQARVEQHQFDEFAMTRRHQAAQQDYAVC